MDKILFIQTGMGIDVHGQNVTKASLRAIQDRMEVNVKLAIPRDQDQLDENEVKEAIPYGTVSVEVVEGGMATTSGIILEDKEDSNDLM